LIITGLENALMYNEVIVSHSHHPWWWLWKNNFFSAIFLVALERFYLENDRWTHWFGTEHYLLLF